MSDPIKHISLDLIDYPKIAMRTDADADAIEELMASMKDIGMMEPIVVRPVGERFEIIAGHRRTRAAKHLHWAVIEAKIVSANDDLTLVMRLAENLSRHDVDPVDEASFIGEIMLERKLSAEQVAAMLKRRQEWVDERLEVFSFPDYLKSYVKNKAIPLGAALWINRIGNENQKNKYAHWAGAHGVGVRGAKYWYDLYKSAPNLEDISVGEIKDLGSAAARKEALVMCERCGVNIPMMTARNVWVHPDLECPAPVSEKIAELPPG